MDWFTNLFINEAKTALDRHIVTGSGGNGITDATIASQLANKADKATTLAGYGIKDAYTKTEVDGMNSNMSTRVKALESVTYAELTAEEVSALIAANTNTAN